MIPSVATPTVALVAVPISFMGWLALKDEWRVFLVFLLVFLHGIHVSPAFYNSGYGLYDWRFLFLRLWGGLCF